MDSKIVRLSHSCLTGAIEPFNVYVLRRLAGLYKRQLDSSAFSPLPEYLAEMLGAIIQAEHLRQPAQFGDALQHAECARKAATGPLRYPGPSWLKSSITLNVRKLRPSDKASCMKSMDQASLIRCDTAKGCGLSRFRPALA